MRKVIAVPGMSHKRAERLARETVLAYDPARLEMVEPFPIEHFFEFHLPKVFDVTTGPANLPTGVEGVTDAQGNIMIALEVWDDLLAGDGRARFTAAHEAAHAIAHLPFVQQLRCQLRAGGDLHRYATEELPAFLNPEWQANRVASAILMPGPAVRKLVRERGPSVEAMSHSFMVSKSAARVRLDVLRRVREL